MASEFRYESRERRPIEILIFQVDPDDVERFLELDHEIWTLKEAFADGLDQIPMLSKEVWLNDAAPGEITIVIEWETMEQWDIVDAPDLQAALTKEFDARFDRPYKLVRAVHDEQAKGIHRWSRFERSR